MKIKTSVGERIFQVFNYFILTGLMIACLYPMWHVVMASLSDPNALISHSGLVLHPIEFSTMAYERVFQNKLLWQSYLNTFKLLALSLTLQMTMTILGAYFLSRPNLMLRRPIMLLITFTMFFSGGMIPYYLNLRELGLNNSIWGLVLPSAINTYNLIILRTSFESIPVSLQEAARIDGAGDLTILGKIILPLSKATLAVIALYYGVQVWNSWFWATIILRNRTEYPLQAVLREVLIENVMEGMDSGMPSPETIRYATIVVATVPILCIYPFIQKYFTKGVMIGAVKG